MEGSTERYCFAIPRAVACLKMATVIIIQLYSSARFIMAGDGSPPAYNEKITRTEKSRGEVFVCVWVCASLYLLVGGWHLCVFVVCRWNSECLETGTGSEEGVTQHNPSGWCVHPVYLSAFSRPPLPPLIWMELIGPSTSLYGWLVCVFFHHSCWVPKKKQMCSFCYSLN